MPKRFFLPSNTGIALAAACFSALVLSGCATTKETADATGTPPQTAKPASTKGILAKGGTTASSRYVDPVISKAPRQEQAQAQVPEAAATTAFPPAPAQPASIAGLATQPTAIRAGSGTIFATNPPATAAPSASPSASDPVQTELPKRNFNATTASLFGSQPAAPAAACGADPQGNALNC